MEAGRALPSDGEIKHTDDDPDVARVVCKERPEIAACLDGMVFRGPDEATALLLRAALLNVASNVLSEFEYENAIPQFAGDLQDRALRLILAGKALERNLQLDEDGTANSNAATIGYSAEIQELLHGRFEPLELSKKERDVVLARVESSLSAELRGTAADDESRRPEELRAILADIGSNEDAGEGGLIARLPAPRLAEWLTQWEDEVKQASPDERRGEPMPLADQAPLLGSLRERLLDTRKTREGLKLSSCPPLLPHAVR
jgi:hypothetical protein